MFVCIIYFYRNYRKKKIPIKAVKAEIETHALIVEAKIRKRSI